MVLDGAWNAYIFREGKTSVRGSGLVNELVNGLLAFDEVAPNAKRTALIDLLMRAGELEGALLDAGSRQGNLVAAVTDSLANSLVSGHPVRAEELALRTRIIETPKQVVVAPPEGFAYYSLHPLDFADLVTTISTTVAFAAVIGIRSIGTTLSAVVQAALRNRGIQCKRTTVRPTGHPYDRRTEFTPEQLRWISSMQLRLADFFVVDEGPGMSGSSFLSVGDALLAAGVPKSNIVFLGSREPQPSSLTAPHAAERWPAYRSYSTRPTRHLPHGADLFIAGGIWRAYVYADQQQWPASWLQMERLKFFSADEDTLLKFEGYGRFGQSVHERSVCVAKGGFGPMPVRVDEGFGVYPRLRGRSLARADVTPVILQRIADYCAFRSRAMSTSVPVNAELETMLRFNVKEEFGADLPARLSELRVLKSVIADGRMLPHKWIDSDGVLLKVDSATHGDDHFFPGPTDIAWDLAGAIVEWDLAPDTARMFLDCYYRSSGDDARGRVSNYLIAYSIFRTAYCKMASASMQGSEEESRLIRDYYRYRAQAQQYITQTAAKEEVPKLLLGGQSSELSVA
jgi:hypothetical protein